jgi:hypothetical protein
MRRFTPRSAGLKHGWRSGLEEQVMGQLRADGIPFEYEQVVIEFRQPEKPRKYTPDFLLLRNGIIIETKGRFVTADRQKHLLVQTQHPALDIRFVFSNSRQRISKQSQTTYAAWCQTKGFKFADKRIPQAWLVEPVNKRSLEYALNLMEG